MNRHESTDLYNDGLFSSANSVASWKLTPKCLSWQNLDMSPEISPQIHRTSHRCNRCASFSELAQAQVLQWRDLLMVYSWSFMKRCRTQHSHWWCPGLHNPKGTSGYIRSGSHRFISFRNCLEFSPMKFTHTSLILFIYNHPTGLADFVHKRHWPELMDGKMTGVDRCGWCKSMGA